MLPAVHVKSVGYDRNRSARVPRVFETQEIVETVLEPLGGDGGLRILLLFPMHTALDETSTGNMGGCRNDF